MKAVWNNQIVAESNDTILIEGNHYFPQSSIVPELFIASTHHTTCFWKGEASYYNIVVDGKTNENAAWYYPEPPQSAQDKVGSDFSNYVAFWNGVEVTS